MNIIVLIKQVPDTTEIKIDPKTGTLIREGVESIINDKLTDELLVQYANPGFSPVLLYIMSS